MEILYLLIPVAVIVLIAAIWAFLWAIKNGQYEDLEGPAYRILMDDDDSPVPGSNAAQKPAERTDGARR